MDFYDQLADEYEGLTGQAQRLQTVHAFADRVIDTWQPASILDVACGTGLFALEFAHRGMRVTGADLSAGMLAKATALADKERLSINWVEAPMQDLHQHLPARDRFDLIVCMGNSIPHLLSDRDLNRTLHTFHKRLEPGGRALIHLLNYDKVLAENDRIVGVSRTDPDHEYVRFYDFDGETLRFNVLRITWENGTAAHDLVTTTLRPYRSQQLDGALRNAGFSQVECAGKLDLSPFDTTQSDVLLVIATK